MLGLVGPVASGATGTRVRVKLSPPGQVSIAAINARQNEILGLKRFQALLELARAFRSRPLAFNGGASGAVIAPDVIAINEFRELNVEVFDRLVRNKFDEPYQIVGPTDKQAGFIVNTRTVEPLGEVQMVDDACLHDEASDMPRHRRQYPLARFREISTGSLFTVISVHLARDYSSSGESDCLAKNVRALRAAVANDPGAVFVAGDFNFRATEPQYECDSAELAPSTHWWNVMTEGDDAADRKFVDSVQAFHRERSLSMVDEWTFQTSTSVTLCNGGVGHRRARIDYIFTSGAEVAEAHADHPGWSDPANYQYSDHRFVLGRFVLSGPPRVPAPTTVQQAGGVIEVSWPPVEGAASYIVYRARPARDYATLATVGGDVNSLVDTETIHGTVYRYAIAAVGPDAGQGVESRPVWQEADALGPIVTSIEPGRDAQGVKPDVTIRASFSEYVKPSSVTSSTISLFRNGNRVPGSVVRKGGFVIKFNPAFLLKKGETFTILVRPVTDVLGNPGSVFRSRFSTVEPPKRRKRSRR